VTRRDIRGPPAGRIDPGRTSMRRSLLGLVLVPALAASARAQAPSRGPELTYQQVNDWQRLHATAWRALGRGDLDRAESEFLGAARIARVEAEADPRLLARTYADLAWVLHRRGRDAEAEPLAAWALAVRASRFGASSIQVAQTSYTLGAIEVNLGKLDEAEGHMARALAACEATLSPTGAGTADAIDDLAAVLVLRRRYDRARPLYDRAAAIYRAIDPDHPGQAVALDGLAGVEIEQGRLDEADAHLSRAAALLDRGRGADPSTLAAVLNRRAGLLRRTGRPDEAARAEARAREVVATPRAGPKPIDDIPTARPGMTPAPPPGR